MSKIIYLDNAATTEVNPNLMKKLHSIISYSYGNPSSQHKLGRDARELIESARGKIAKFINANPEEIIFTSGGTESANLAIKGLALANPNKKHIITTVIEHSCVLETCKNLQSQGYSVDYISVDKLGLVNPKEIESKITNNTLLVSVMHVNNEIGTIQPIGEIAGICRKKGVYFYTDSVQGFGKIDIDVKKMNIGLLSASGHKLNAPKGIGILYVKKGIKLYPIIQGGGQENGIRSGTENVSGALGMALAVELKRNQRKIQSVRDRLLKEILKIPHSRLNGSFRNRIYNNINVSFYGIEGEGLLLLLDKSGICVATGSACSSHKLEESHVLKAINVDPLCIHGSIRLTLDTIKPLSNSDIKFISSKIRDAVAKLRKMSPFKTPGDEKYFAFQGSCYLE